jgi:hypothetical protein
MSDIEDLICRKAGDFTLDIPRGAGWQRMKCRWCGKDRAQVHHGDGLFWCPHAACLKRFTVTGEWSAVAQFRDQLHCAIETVKVGHKYGGWVKHWEAKNFCEEKILQYVRDGLPDAWELDVP